MAKPIQQPISLIIPAAQGGQRLDKALAALLAGQEPVLSRARLQSLIAEKCLSRDGIAVTNSSRKVREGEQYQLLVPKAVPAKLRAQKIPLDIIYEDKDIIVINKPAGLVVHPAAGNADKTLVNALLAHCGKSLSGIGGVARPGIVHRLDKDTSGLLVAAKNDKAHQVLTAQFADRSLSRTYLAVVSGVPHPARGSLEGNIGRHPRDRKRMAVTARGKPALTHYRVLERFNADASLVECNLATGRTHQIRVHMAEAGHPLLGDALYRVRKKAPGPAFGRQALHATALRLIHPRSGKSVAFKADMPRDMEDLIKLLRSKTAVKGKTK
jgi:23S rRNA pseudouridine1911/1915/1917 synthase